MKNEICKMYVQEQAYRPLKPQVTGIATKNKSVTTGFMNCKVLVSVAAVSKRCEIYVKEHVS